jgi:hypothetical protein
MRSSKPPAVATWLLEHLQSGSRNDHITGDLMEAYQHGRSRAWYWKQVLAAIMVSFRFSERIFRRKDVNSNSTARTILFWMFIVVLFMVLWRVVSARGQSTHKLEPSYSEFISQVDRGNVKEVTLYLSQNSYEVEGEYREPAQQFRVTIFKESSTDLTKELLDKGALMNVKAVTRADWINFLLTAAPLILLVAFWISTKKRPVPNSGTLTTA